MQLTDSSGPAGTSALIGIFIFLAAPLGARTIAPAHIPAIDVCMEENADKMAILLAQAMASKMFLKASVFIVWRQMRDCRTGDIRIVLSQRASPEDHPDTYGYAFPYEGKHVVIFWDRIAAPTDSRTFPYLLAHVLVHELTHVLQGIHRHSDTGVMKREFKATDLGEMILHTLPFTDEDVYLIQRGIASRQAHAE